MTLTFSSYNVGSNTIVYYGRAPYRPPVKHKKRGDAHRYIPVELELVIAPEPPEPPPVLWAVRQWRARRQAARRRRLPLRSRPGALL